MQRKIASNFHKKSLEEAVNSYLLITFFFNDVILYFFVKSIYFLNYLIKKFKKK